jgi:hypothetical protein
MHQNATSYSMALASMSPDGVAWDIGIAVFIGTIIGLFLAIKFFRAFIYGGIVSAVLWAIGWYSHEAGSAAASGDYAMVTFWCRMAGFTAVSVGIGLVIQNMKSIKKFEAKLK